MAPPFYRKKREVKKKGGKEEGNWGGVRRWGGGGGPWVGAGVLAELPPPLPDPSLEAVGAEGVLHGRVGE